MSVGRGFVRIGLRYVFLAKFFYNDTQRLGLTQPPLFACGVGLGAVVGNPFVVCILSSIFNRAGYAKVVLFVLVNEGVLRFSPYL